MLRADLADVAHAFAVLSGRREVGMDVGRISSEEIDGWADRHGFGGETRLEFFEQIDAMDRAWLEWHRSRDKTEQKHAEPDRRDRQH